MTARAQALAKLCREFHVDILYAFGSRADELRKWIADVSCDLSAGPSDVDIGVKAKGGVNLSPHDKVRMALDLEDLLSVPRVDLVCLSNADPFLAANIIRGERLYVLDEVGADEYDLYVLRRAGDLAPLERERMEMILGGSK